MAAPDLANMGQVANMLSHKYPAPCSFPLSTY